MSAPEPLRPGSTPRSQPAVSPPEEEDRRSRRTRAACSEEPPAEDRRSAGSGGGTGSCDRCSSSCPRCLQRAGPGGAPPDSAGPRCCCCCCCPLSLSRLRGSASGWAPAPLLRRGGEAPGPAGGDTERRRRSCPERREADNTGRDMFLWPSQIYKPTELQCEQHKSGGVLSDSENEEPVGKKTRMVSAFIRRNAKSAKDVSQRTVQRSQSCTDSVEGKGKVRLISQPSSLDKMCVSHSDTAGILLSSENSLGRRSLSAPIAADRRPVGWRALMTSPPSSCPAASSQQPRGSTLCWSAMLQPQQQRERSASPESSSDSISEELNHFKPIVSSPCTPPKRLPDGRLLQPSIVKSTPRNLTRGLQSANTATSYEVGPALLQKWRQIELDRNRNRDPSFVVASKATLTEATVWPSADTGAEQGGCGTVDEVKGRIRVDALKGSVDRDTIFTMHRRALFQQTEETDTASRQKQLVRVFVPARRLSGSLDPHQTGSAAAPNSRTETPLCKKQTFSPPSDRNSRSVRSGKTEALKDPHRKVSSDGGSRSSRRGRKRSHKSRHLEEGAPGSEVRRGSQEIVEEEEEEEHCDEEERCLRDGALALRLQRHFDLEQDDPVPDKYFLRSWSSNQNRRRSRRIAKQHS